MGGQIKTVLIKSLCVNHRLAKFLKGLTDILGFVGLFWSKLQQLNFFFSFKDYFSGAVLGSRQNGGVGKEISHISSALNMHNLFPIINISHQSDTLVITDEPTLIYHNYPSPYVYIRVHY